ncbi:hypothetical protein D3C85_1187130 [compost metagenome]
MHLHCAMKPKNTCTPVIPIFQRMEIPLITSVIWPEMKFGSHMIKGNLARMPGRLQEVLKMPAILMQMHGAPEEGAVVRKTIRELGFMGYLPVSVTVISFWKM